MESVNKYLYLAYKNTNFGAKSSHYTSSISRSALVNPLNLCRLPLRRPQLPVELPGNVQGQLGETDGLQVAEDGHHDAVRRRVALGARVVRPALTGIPGNDEEDAGGADGAASVQGTKFLGVQVKSSGRWQYNRRRSLSCSHQINDGSE